MITRAKSVFVQLFKSPKFFIILSVRSFDVMLRRFPALVGSLTERALVMLLFVTSKNAAIKCVVDNNPFILYTRIAPAFGTVFVGIVFA